ncbi:hypothetical protein DPSP01_008244 [Paraphaeosphaeria sporulosa]|uniref:Uncharacterized protein n=1 Tax=Paraphaeosphaeria sporulosa TaxID=1460663 RepID=A0A177BX67_9PLEO|nr:uncharacterized protein CC84DRAFT_1264647 [Paraphaeosphaeria sporulosa]OAF99107.1 hypothetical protein CC84DRAFT_1264647 [Paraphaeosphaeria sporulosa]
MSALEPTGPSQPSLNQAYTTPGNAATKEPAEQIQTDSNARSIALDNSEPVDRRVPNEQVASGTEGQAKAPGGGIHGAPPGEEAKGLTEEDVGRHNELDGAQMAAPGEGDIAAAVANNNTFGAGGAGKEQDFASDLDRKKAEQQEARDQMKSQRQAGASMGGALGQTGGPANPVDQGGYPNGGV